MLPFNKMNELSSVDYKVMMSKESDAYIGQIINNTGSMKFYNMSWDDLFLNISNDNNLIEFIPALKPCKMYFDFDAKYTDMDEEEKEYFTNTSIKKIVAYISSHIKDFCNDNELPKPFLICSQSCHKDKVSAHIVIKNIILPTNKHRKAFYSKLIDYIGDDDIITKFIDKNVYNSSDKAMKMRMINQSKLNNNVPLTTLHKVKQSSHIITYTENEPITSIPDEWIPKEKVYTPRPEEDSEFENDFAELKSLLSRISRNTEYKDWSTVGQVIFNITKGDDDGLEIFIDWSRSAPNFDEDSCYNFWKNYKINEAYGLGVLVNMIDNIEPEMTRLLPIKEKEIEPEVKEIIFNNKVDIIKEDYYWVDFESKYLYTIFDSYEDLKQNIIKDLPRVLVKILYSKGFYIKKEHENDLCNIVKIEDMKRVVFKFNQSFKDKKGRIMTDIQTISLNDIYIECNLPVYSHIDIILDKNKKTKAYNTFKGIKATQKDKFDMDLINKFFKHIEDIICNDNKEAGHFFISWMRWIMINPHIKSKVFMFLFSGEGYGKSTIGDFLSNFVFGDNTSYICSGLDSITKHFNKHLMGKLFCQVEELPATSETFHTQFTKMKHYITDHKLEITPKGIDSFKVDNHLNFLSCSNNKYSIRISKDDTRYFTTEIKKKMPKSYWTEYYKDFQNQDFADMLYSYFLSTKNEDFVDFTGRPDIPMTELKQDLIDFSLPVYEKFYKDINEGIYELNENIIKEPFTYKDKEYKYATSLQELYNEYLNWGSLNGERDLKRKYLEFKQYNNGGKFRFIDLQEKIDDIDKVSFKSDIRLLS